MPPEIDAEGIDALTKDWPADAKVRGAYYSPDRKAMCDGEGIVILDHIAYHAAVGSGLAWLADDDLSPQLSSINGKSYVYCVSTSCEYEGPHPLAAVSAAVLAAKGGA